MKNVYAAPKAPRKKYIPGQQPRVARSGQFEALGPQNDPKIFARVQSWVRSIEGVQEYLAMVIDADSDQAVQHQALIQILEMHRRVLAPHAAVAQGAAMPWETASFVTGNAKAKGVLSS